MKSTLPRCFAALVAIALLICAAEALDVQGFVPEVNNRFISGYPMAPVPNNSPQFVGAGLDWSGVCWETNSPTYNYCLITPKHFLYASHMSPNVGELVSFVNRDGALKTYSVYKTTQVGADGQSVKVDTGVATLSDPIPARDHITHYKIFSLGPKGRPYVGLPLLMYGHTAVVGRNQIVDALLIAGLNSEFNYLTAGLTRGMARTESGDSGAPSFVVSNGELAVIGTHWKSDTDILLPGVIDGLNRIVKPDGYSVEVLDASAH